MKDKLFGALIAAVIFSSAAPAIAQDTFENEFEQFKRKSAAAKAGKAADETPAAETAAPAAAPKEPVDDPLATLQSAANANPLGPAGNLPVEGQAAATALATGPQTPEEVQAEMEAEMIEQKAKMKEQTFKAALEALMPLTPEQIRITLDEFRKNREAAETPITVPEPKSRVESISLDPSAPPQIIKLAPGYVTTVSLLDMTGMPWAIQDLSWAGKVSISTPETGGHVLRLTPAAAHGSGNVSIRLVDLVTPVTFRFEIGLEEVDYRFDARVPKQGPLAKTPLIEYGGIKSVAGEDDNIFSVLDGTVTGDARKLKVDGTDGRTTAWRIDETVYLRTPLTLLSPAWNESATSADGMNVYTIEDVPVVLLSDRGRMIKARVSADEGGF